MTADELFHSNNVETRRSQCTDCLPPCTPKGDYSPTDWPSDAGLRGQVSQVRNLSLYYFVSDVHLGVCSCDRAGHEAKFVRFLDSLPKDTKALFLLGDIFDFWYEYKYVIPSGHTRALGKLAQLCDSGVEVYFFKGNHDLWAYGYFENEIGMKVVEQPAVMEIGGKRFCLGHGDGLGKTTFGFKFIRWMFYNRFLQVLFSTIHPRWALGLGYAWAAHSRKIKTCPPKNGEEVKEYRFVGKDSPLYPFANQFGKGKNIDYYIFGHFHTPGEIEIPTGGRMIILGDWINGCEYAVFDGESVTVDKIVC